MSHQRQLCFDYLGWDIPMIDQILVDRSESKTDKPARPDLWPSHRVVHCAVPPMSFEQVHDIHHKLDRILEMLSQLTWLLAKESALTMAALDDLTAQVKANTDVEASAITLIQGLADALKAAGTDPTKLAALQQQLLTSQTALAAAITANTPAGPPAPAPTP